jgi:asparagine synthase (glutamine-hydrolysing)
LWDPWAIARETIDDPVVATSEVRRTTADVVHCWASLHQNVLHGLGGLDSSIVCACLATAPSRPRVTCYTYHSQGANSDERIFARLVAARAGVELLEVERTPCWDLEPLLHSMRRSPTFGNHVSYVEPASVEGNLARRGGATAITSGFGGDQLFVQAYPHAAVDYAARHGMGRACWSLALDDARMEGRSFWAVLWEVIRAIVFRRFADPTVPIDGTRALIPDEVLSATKKDRETLHPHVRRWITDSAMRTRGYLAVASGKVSQVQQLLYPPQMRNPLAAADDPELIAPLFSQPLLELCVRIPTWVHTGAGQDRVIARRAFLDQIPHEVASRWTKGGWEEQAAGLLKHNIRFVRSLLIDGELMRRGLVIRSRLEEWLSYRPTRLSVSNVEIFHVIFAEAWLRSLGSVVSR